MRIPQRKRHKSNLWKRIREQNHRSDQREKVIKGEPIPPVFREQINRKDEIPNGKL